MGTLGELLLVLGLASELLLPPIGKSARARRAAAAAAMAVAALAARRFAGTSTRRGPSPYWRCGGEAASSDEEGDENGMGGIANGNADGTCGALARARSHEAELAPKRGLLEHSGCDCNPTTVTRTDPGGFSRDGAAEFTYREPRLVTFFHIYEFTIAPLASPRSAAK